MKKLFKNIILFSVLAIIIGEIIVRLTHAVSDIPQRTIDEHGIQKYFPNQEGYWKGGEHQWIINDYGWPGELPTKYDNLINIIGDSFIENFMNPNECHQSAFLKKLMPDYNFFEAARAGVSLIEAMEISKQNDSLNPKLTLIYVNESDFYESILNIEKLNDITQIDLKEKKIVYGEMRSPSIKKVLYSWKLLYYFYNRFSSSFDSKQEEKLLKTTLLNSETNNLKFSNDIDELISFISNNYDMNDKVLVFRPNSDIGIINQCKRAGFNIIFLHSEGDATWTFEYDHHWTCYGNEKAAEQIYKGLKSRVN